MRLCPKKFRTRFASLRPSVNPNPEERLSFQRDRRFAELHSVSRFVSIYEGSFSSAFSRSKNGNSLLHSFRRSRNLLSLPFEVALCRDRSGLTAVLTAPDSVNR